MDTSKIRDMCVIWLCGSGRTGAYLHRTSKARPRSRGNVSHILLLLSLAIKWLCIRDSRHKR